MKDRPILFSAPMVKAILEGRKTQTRRVANGISKLTTHFTDYQHLDGSFEQEGVCLELGKMRCPHGVVGDRLWVKETWAFVYDCGAKEAYYKADGACHEFGGTWRPSIVMPRWASRITLEITEIRVQRLQDISEDDCIAEGVQAPKGYCSNCDEPPEAIYEFMRLWDSINGKKHPFESNPWVWAISFQRVVE